MTDRATLIQTVARMMGAQVGTIGASTTTTAILPGLIDTTGDDQAYVNARIIFPEAPNEASRQTLITAWDDSIGQATYLTRTDSKLEAYIVMDRRDYVYSEFKEALDDALEISRRSYRQVIPAIPGERFYSLGSLDWLEGAGDVDQVFLSESPNMLQNESYSLWDNGVALAPDGWALAGVGATVAQTTATQRGSYAATVTRVGADATLSQPLPSALVQYLTRSGIALQTLRAGAWVTATVASRARVGIYDGVTTTWSDYHTGSGTPEWLEASLPLTATMTTLQMVDSVDTGNTSATFSGAVFVPGASAISTTLKNSGSDAYREYQVPKITRNVGGAPMVELQSPSGAGQVVVYCRRRFARVSSDSQVIDNQYERVLEAGLAVMLLINIKAGVDRTRYDRVLDEQTPIWTRALATITDLPVQAPMTQVQIVSA